MARQTKVFVYWLGPGERLAYIAALVIVTPVLEEVFHRGQVFLTLRNNFGTAVGVMGSTLLFSIMHGLAPVAFLQGVLLALVFQYSGSIWGSITVHAANNALWYILFVS